LQKNNSYEKFKTHYDYCAGSSGTVTDITEHRLCNGETFLFPFGDAHDSFAAYLYRDWFSSWTAGGAQGKAEIEISTNLHYTD
jgi:hypothetical protein